jgi:hypothetical protein
MSGFKKKQNQPSKSQSSLFSFFKPPQTTPPASQSPALAGPPSSMPSKVAGNSSDSMSAPANPVGGLPAALVNEFKFPEKFAPSQVSLGAGDSAIVESEACQPPPAPTVSISSGLSPPPSSSEMGSLASSPKPAVSSVAPAGRVVRSSDDEESDSDSSLEDLTALLQSNGSGNFPKPPTKPFIPSTPTVSRFRKKENFHTSPLAVLPKYKFDLKALASHAQTDDAVEASSKRIKAMLADSKVDAEGVLHNGSDSEMKRKRDEILHSVVGDAENGEGEKVMRAVKRTEATLSDQAWYFFDRNSTSSKPAKSSFPTKSIPEDLKKDLKNPQVRYQTFVSGFAEDMVSLGKIFPDEILLWMLDEILIEPTDCLRDSYCNVLTESSGQINHLIDHDVLRKIFQSIGATRTAIVITEKIVPIQALTDPYPKKDWTQLHTLIRFLGRIAEFLEIKSYVLCLLLRMCIDRLVPNNVDLFDLVQDTIVRFCTHVPEDSWDECVSLLLRFPCKCS